MTSAHVILKEIRHRLRVAVSLEDKSDLPLVATRGKSLLELWVTTFFPTDG